MPGSPTEKDIIALTEPGVVRVLYDLKGIVEVEPFDIDVKTLEFVSLGKKKETLPIDITISGTGYIVSPNGYILTNAHVVSSDAILSSILKEISLNVFTTKGIKGEISDAELKHMEEMIATEDDAKTEQRMKGWLKFVTLKNTLGTLTVLNPSTSGSNLDDYRKDGFPATVVEYPSDYLFSDKDVALIHINEKNLPALSLAEKASPEKGDTIYTFGFPASADVNKSNLLNASFTSGLVSGGKDSSHKDFKMIQTSAKISEGSSGSPMLDKSGHVIGTITFQSGDQSIGDNFGFAIPIDISRELLSSHDVTATRGKYQADMTSGITLKNERHCKKAIESFGQAKSDIDPNFLHADLVDSYISSCEAMIASGQSIDSKWDEFKNSIASISGTVWLIVLSSILGGIILIIVVVFLMRRLRKEESEMDELENIVINQRWQKDEQGEKMPATKKPQEPLVIEKKSTQSQSIGSASSPARVVLSIPPTIPPEVTTYVSTMLRGGFSKETIIAELVKGGWTEKLARVAVE